MLPDFGVLDLVAVSCKTAGAGFAGDRVGAVDLFFGTGTGNSGTVGALVVGWALGTTRAFRPT